MMKQKPKKPKRKNIEVPQASGPTDNVTNEAVYEEMDDSLERAATISTSLDAKQDRGNINKTQSKATLNEPCFIGTSSGSGPRRQDTMGDTIAQTGFENVSKTSNDSLLAGVNTPQSDEDSLKLKELMELIESSEDEGLGEEDASKQGRIDDIDANEDIYLVNVHRDEDMFGVIDLEGDEVIVEIEVASKDVNFSVDEVTLAQALASLKSAKPKADKVMIQEPEQGTITTTTTAATTVTAANTRPKAKGLVIHEEKQATTPTAKIDVDYQLAQRLQAQEQEELIDEEKARLFIQFLKQRRKYFTTKEYHIEQKKQKVEEDKESEELKQCLEIILDNGDDVTIDATPLSTKSPTIVDYKIYKEGKKSYFQIIRADGNSQMYLTFGKMLKNFNREDLEVLWSIVKARFKKTEPVNYMDNFLLLKLKTMFEHHVEDSVWKNQQGLVKVLNWKLYDSCGVHCVTMQSILYYLLVEKMYPLTNHTLHQMFNDVKLQVDYECEMAFELLRLVKKQLKEGYVPE
ncbi:hypothetical protein Tco_0296216 [Tanacetum coccineum]